MAVEIAAEILDPFRAQLPEQHHQLAGVELPERDRHAAEQLAITLFAPLQLGRRLLLGRDVHHRADELELPPSVDHSVGDHADVPDRAILQQKPVLQGKILPVLRRALDGFANDVEIVGMRALQDDVERRRQIRIEIEDPEGLVGPEQLLAGNVPAEAAGVTELLGLGEIGGLTSPQRVFAPEPMQHAHDHQRRDEKGDQGGDVL